MSSFDLEMITFSPSVGDKSQTVGFRLRQKRKMNVTLIQLADIQLKKKPKKTNNFMSSAHLIIRWLKEKWQSITFR